jgi:hypothetical protein
LVTGLFALFQLVNAVYYGYAVFEEIRPDPRMRVYLEIEANAVQFAALFTNPFGEDSSHYDRSAIMV